MIPRGYGTKKSQVVQGLPCEQTNQCYTQRNDQYYENITFYEIYKYEKSDLTAIAVEMGNHKMI